MNKEIIFLNLTNGIEYLKEWNKTTSLSFIRIQSTTIERKDWFKLFMDLDHNFLINLAIGTECKVIDYGTNKPYSKTIYYGIPLIRYILNRFWFGIDDKESNILKRNGEKRIESNYEYFNNIYNNLFIFDRNSDKDRLSRKLKYYKKFLNCSEINLKGISFQTSNDGNYPFYKQILIENYAERN